MSDLRLDIVRDDHTFVALRGEWTDLAAADPEPNVFLTWPWAYTWWQRFGLGRAHHELHIAVVRDAVGVVGIAPLYTSRVGVGPVFATAIRRINHDAGDYGGMLLGRRADEAVALLVEHLGAQLHGGQAVVVLSRLASDARFTALLGDELVRHAATIEPLVESIDTCLLTDVSGGFNLNKLAKKHKIRQRLRRLGEAHDPVEFVVHTGDTLEAGLERLVTLHDRRWEEIDEPMQGLLADDEREQFLLDAIRALDAEGMVQLRSIEAAGAPVAVELDFLHQRRLFLFRGAFDPAFAEFSPGQLLNHKVFEDGLAAGIEVFDFCRGDASYKRRWTNRERHLTTITLSRPGLSGAAARQRFRVARALERRVRARRARPTEPSTSHIAARPRRPPARSDDDRPPESRP